MIMRRRFLLVLLALGSVAGFASAFQSWRWHREFGWGPHAAWHHGYGERDAERLDRLAEACVRAAQGSAAQPQPAQPQPAPSGPPQ
jgi:hypothetical protein